MSVLICFFVLAEARRVRFETLQELEEAEAFDPLRFDALFELLLDEYDRFLLVGRTPLGL